MAPKASVQFNLKVQQYLLLLESYFLIFREAQSVQVNVVILINITTYIIYKLYNLTNII